MARGLQFPANVDHRPKLGDWPPHGCCRYMATPEAASLNKKAHQCVARRCSPSRWFPGLLLRCGWRGLRMTAENNVDRHGQDYRNFDLSSPSPDSCRDACASDSDCKTYTYVKPGVQGPNARCWLKSGLPPGTPSSCCVSGLKSVSPGGFQRGHSPKLVRCYGCFISLACLAAISRPHWRESSCRLTQVRWRRTFGC
ncbi:MAG: PAN domain-containing protein [Pyrinomonadaceae bacterium]